MDDHPDECKEEYLKAEMTRHIDFPGSCNEDDTWMILERMHDASRTGILTDQDAESGSKHAHIMCQAYNKNHFNQPG